MWWNDRNINLFFRLFLKAVNIYWSSQNFSHWMKIFTKYKPQNFAWLLKCFPQNYDIFVMLMWFCGLLLKQGQWRKANRRHGWNSALQTPPPDRPEGNSAQNGREVSLWSGYSRPHRHLSLGGAVCRHGMRIINEDKAFLVSVIDSSPEWEGEREGKRDRETGSLFSVLADWGGRERFNYNDIKKRVSQVKYIWAPCAPHLYSLAGTSSAFGLTYVRVIGQPR